VLLGCLSLFAWVFSNKWEQQPKKKFFFLGGEGEYLAGLRNILTLLLLSLLLHCQEAVDFLFELLDERLLLATALRLFAFSKKKK